MSARSDSWIFLRITGYLFSIVRIGPADYSHFWAALRINTATLAVIGDQRRPHDPEDTKRSAGTSWVI